MALLDQRAIPCVAVLLAEGDQLPIGRDPRRATSLDEKHEGQQAGRLAVLGQQRADQASEPDRLGREVGTHGVGTRAGGEVALVEDQVTAPRAPH